MGPRDTPCFPNRSASYTLSSRTGYSVDPLFSVVPLNVFRGPTRAWVCVTKCDTKIDNWMRISAVIQQALPNEKVVPDPAESIWIRAAIHHGFTLSFAGETRERGPIEACIYARNILKIDSRSSGTLKSCMKTLRERKFKTRKTQMVIHSQLTFATILRHLDH